jgi:hypothetical protein
MVHVAQIKTVIDGATNDTRANFARGIELFQLFLRTLFHWGDIQRAARLSKFWFCCALIIVASTDVIVATISIANIIGLLFGKGVAPFRQLGNSVAYLINQDINHALNAQIHLAHRSRWTLQIPLLTSTTKFVDSAALQNIKQNHQDPPDGRCEQGG